MCNVDGRAGDGSRTRDVQLGRLELYQLSYSRVFRSPCSFVKIFFPVVDGVDGEGFEPSKPVATDLQSVPFDRSGTRPGEYLESLRPCGAGEGTRTRNLLITNQLLYQLSYASTRCLCDSNLVVL
jgi:hypothetical protein